MLPVYRRVFPDNSFTPEMKDGFRHEIKYALSNFQYLKIRDFCLIFMDHDKNAGENGEYTVKSYYFDTLYFSDYSEKLNGIYERKKYRLRTYGDSGYYRLEKKLKNGNLNKKISGDISAGTADMLIKGCTDVRTGNTNTDAIITEMYLKGCRNSVYIEYSRQAFVLKELDIRITFDRNLGALYGNYGLGDKMPDLLPFFDEGEAVLEIKYKDTMPKWIENAVHKMAPGEYSLSKYAQALRSILR